MHDFKKGDVAMIRAPGHGSNGAIVEVLGSYVGVSNTKKTLRYAVKRLATGTSFHIDAAKLRKP